MESQLEIIGGDYVKQKILNSIPSKDLELTVKQYELEIDTQVKAGTLDFIIGEKRKDYYKGIAKNRQELLSSDPVTFVTENNDDIKSALETIESTEDLTQKNILQSQLATSLITAAKELGVPKYQK